MFVIGNILGTVASILNSLVFLYSLVIIANSILSWVNPDPYNALVRTLRALSEPVLSWIRRRFPFMRTGGFDLSPIAVLLALWLFDGIVVASLQQFARTLY